MAKASPMQSSNPDFPEENGGGKSAKKKINMRLPNIGFRLPNKPNIGFRGPAGPAVEVSVLGTKVPRMALWGAAGAASIVIVGQVGINGAIYANSGAEVIAETEQIALTAFSSVGLVVSTICAVFEHFSPGTLESKPVILASGFALFVAGVGSVLTVLFGLLEPVGVIVSSVALAMSGAFVLIEPLSTIARFNNVKARVTAAQEKVQHGIYSVGLIVSLLLHAIVASVVILNANAPQQGLTADLQIAAVAVGILMLITAAGAGVAGNKLGQNEKYLYLGLTVSLLLSVTLFPPVSKPVLTNLTLLAALGCSGMICKSMFL